MRKREEKKKHERRKQFETVAAADRRGRMGRERETVSSGVSWETTGGIKSPLAVQVGQVFRIIKTEQDH